MDTIQWTIGYSHGAEKIHIWLYLIVRFFNENQFNLKTKFPTKIFHKITNSYNYNKR